MSLVSIIVPNFNHSEYLKQRIESILDQTYKKFEVILLDDCSTDNSLRVLQEYSLHPKVAHFIVNENNSGNTFNQWMKGIELARGSYIWIAESDDIADKNFLKVAVQALQNKKCKIFFTQSYIIDEHGTVQGKWNEKLSLYYKDFVKEGKELIQNYMTFANIIPNASAVVFKKEFLDNKIKERIVSYNINGDWYLWISLLMKGDCAFNCTPLNYFRRHKEAGSLKNVANFKNIEEAFKINIFLKKNGFNINGKSWLRTWIGQSNFSFKTLFKRNFENIYKLSLRLYPLPLSYITYIIVCHKVTVLMGRIR